MKLKGRIPVEPLEEERLTNIERNLVVAVSEMRAPAERAPRRLLAFAGALAAVAIAGFVGYKLRGPGAPEVTQREPQVLAIEDGAIDLGDSEITSTKGTDAKITRESSRTTVAMTRGKLDLHVEHKAGRTFVVEAGDTIIEDIGTRFSVDYDGKGHVEVRVTEGEVKVSRAGKDFQITANEAWTTEDGETTIALLDEKLAAATATQVAMVAPSTQTQAQTQTPVNVGAAASAGGNGSAGTSAGSGATRAKAGKSDAKKAIEAVPLAPQEVGTADPAAAKAKYLELVRNMQEGEDRARIIYSIAVMEHYQKKDKQALHSLSGVTKRQGGEAYRDGLWLEVRIKCLPAFEATATPSTRDDCRVAAERYRTKFPNGSPTGVVDTIVKEISTGQ